MEKIVSPNKTFFEYLFAEVNLDEHYKLVTALVKVNMYVITNKYIASKENDTSVKFTKQLRVQICRPTSGAKLNSFNSKIFDLCMIVKH